MNAGRGENAMTHTITSDELSQILFGGPAREIGPDGRFDVEMINGDVVWHYPDATAPNGKGWPVRRMVGDEIVTLHVEGGRVRSMVADPFVMDRFGTPGASLSFGARDAAKVAAVLASRV